MNTNHNSPLFHSKLFAATHTPKRASIQCRILSANLWAHKSNKAASLTHNRPKKVLWFACACVKASLQRSPLTCTVPRPHRSKLQRRNKSEGTWKRSWKISGQLGLKAQYDEESLNLRSGSNIPWEFAKQRSFGRPCRRASVCHRPAIFTKWRSMMRLWRHTTGRVANLYHDHQHMEDLSDKR